MNHGEIFGELNAVASDSGVWGYFEEQRSHVPRAYQKESEVNYLTKKVIVAVKSGDREKIRKCVDDMLAGWEELGKLNLRGDFRWQRDSETGQELIEALGVLYYFPDIFGCEKLLDRLPSPEPTEQQLQELGNHAGELWIIAGITPQRWLAGLGDVPGELGKIVHDRIIEGRPTLDERVELLKNYLWVAGQIYEFLEQGEDFPNQIIGNSNRRGFMNTYRGMLMRVARIIENTKLEILQMENISSVHAAHGLASEGA